jgi:hypothetical protein
MKSLSIIAACCAVSLLAGCESDFSDKVHSALSEREAPRSRVYQADQKAAFVAARAAAEGMGYRMVHGGPAEGELDALSGISSGDDVGSSRQVSMKVRMEPSGDSGTEVTVSFSEILEADSTNQPGTATETPLRDTPLYEVFFRNVQQALLAPAAAGDAVSK